MQLLPTIEFASSCLVLPLKPRTKGSLTGTRVAGVIGSAIVRHAIAKACNDPALLPFPANGIMLKFAVWVDNIYALSQSVQGAAANLRILERILRNDWRLSYKDDSKLVIGALAPSAAGWVDCDFAWRDPFPVLGHSIDSHGSADADVQAATNACWIRFWTGAGSRKARRLPLRLLMGELERVCWPAWSFRCHWWPIIRTTTAQADRCQRSMVLTFLRLPREKDETEADFGRRRHREASRLIPAEARWGSRCMQSVQSWSSHTLRNHADAWCGPLLVRRRNLGLLARRAWRGSASVFAGFLGIRLSAGRPRRRWEDAVVWRSSELSES